MQISISGQHLDVTPALREHIEEKLEKISRHFDHVTSTHVVLQVEKNRHKAEATINARGIQFHAAAEAGDMYAAIDSMTSKLDRQVLKHKEKVSDHHADNSAKPQA
ncbi:MAG: ribosome-associated translation inhibitor RaiA [Proteobacteria bacterium]|nr:MAG: ribosome-associated translation inhibitor RaiA [Pseudomonadota bacterium]